MLIKKIFTFLLVAFAISTSANAQNIIRTVTDFGTVSKPESVATDASGNLYIVERFGARVRKYTVATKTVSTILTGLTSPRGIAFDELGNFYLSEQHKITKYTSAGVLIGIVAGSGTAGYSGDGAAATAALLNEPNGIAYDKVNKYLYIAERPSRIIRKIDFSVSPAIISTFAGSQGPEGDANLINPLNARLTYFKQPAALAVDAEGSVYWSGLQMYSVFKSNTAGDAVVYVVGQTRNKANSGDGSAAISAQMGTVGAGGLAFDASGNLYISDSFNHRVRKVLQATTAPITHSTISNYAGFNNFVEGSTTIVGGAGEGADPNVTTGNSTIMNAPYGIAFNPASTVMYIAENGGTYAIRAVGSAAVLSTTLPLDLISFDAKAANETSVLNWTSENEVNFKEFIIERKGENDANFTAIGTVATKNLKTTTSYNFIDANPLKGNNYYQLKMVDNDGTFKLSEVKAVKFASLSLAQLSIYPNPVQNSLNLNHAEAGANSSILIYGIDGKLFSKNSVVRNSTQSTIDTTPLKAGQYVLEFNNGGNKQVIKFVK
ncbi:hypothetical protein A5893_02520 [Pedobacter psychrophilus]|uniref:Uncharacterized protein n=1 Tax=Pedobacter psychrophilus TaxID=1826909 RepID=A0A179DLT8_9SPHI|nr:T9SS type A sorting domain-containing protein [Pedobacter psychrophilus]OAQ42011.1 hypothetical protein A5893_02520 [Pedobacter psychrophilus]